jgi:hypothetical protein
MNHLAPIETYPNNNGYAAGYSAKMAGEGEQNETDCCLGRCDAVFMRKCGCAPAWSMGARPIE